MAVKSEDVFIIAQVKTLHRVDGRTFKVIKFVVFETVYYDYMQSQLSSNKVTQLIEIKFIHEGNERMESRFRWCCPDNITRNRIILLEYT